MNHQDCRYEILARTNVGHVAICAACGQVHLSMQYMTLRFEAGAFRALADMIDLARRRMEHTLAPDATPIPHSASGGLH